MSESATTSLSWDVIKSNLQNITEVSGGFSPAERGLITLPTGEIVFVKLGVDDNTRAWAKKEIATYHFLAEHAYPHIPRFLASSPDETAFALEALTEGWDWTDNWTAERLDKTFEAMDALATIRPEGSAKTLFEQKTIDENDDGWGPLAVSISLQDTLKDKLKGVNEQSLADTLDFSAMAETSNLFVFRKDTLVHNDVRADNCAWNAQKREVKLVDWNWTQLGDPRIDTAAVVVNAQNAGLDITKYKAKLDKSTLLWVAGFWFRSAATPIWPNGPVRLRDFQLRSGITAFKLAVEI